MAFLRHIGKIGDRKVAIIFREIPGEAHMCLVVYTEIINAHLHDSLMKCIESEIGQNSENLADALNRTHTIDGKIILQVLHYEGLLKKVQTENVVMTPAPNTKIKLNELNKILDEMKQGEEAVKKLAEMDSSRGLQDPKDVARRMRGDKKETLPVKSGVAGTLDDSSLANNLRQQAAKMTAEAKGLMAEADRLLKEAATMDPVATETVAPKTTRTKKTAKTKEVKVSA
jgi:molybdopterin synthase catalytic subunit